MGNAGHPSISIVEADPDLGELLDPGELERARRAARARLQRLSPGEWDAAAALQRDAHHRGFLIVEGLLSRTVEVLGRRCVELLGNGDVMRPWQWDDEGSHRAGDGQRRAVKGGPGSRGGTRRHRSTLHRRARAG